MTPYIRVLYTYLQVSQCTSKIMKQVFKQLEAHTFGKVSIVGDVNARTDIVMILQYLIWNDNKVNDFIEHLNNQTANLQTL